MQSSRAVSVDRPEHGWLLYCEFLRRDSATLHLSSPQEAASTQPRDTGPSSSPVGKFRWQRFVTRNDQQRNKALGAISEDFQLRPPHHRMPRAHTKMSGSTGSDMANTTHRIRYNTRETMMTVPKGIESWYTVFSCAESHSTSHR